MDLAFGMGDRLEFLDAVELALVRAVVIKRASAHHFHGAVKAGRTSRQPDLAVGAPPDEPQDFVVGNYRKGFEAVAQAAEIQFSS